ncbi:glycosyltransferase [Frigoriglobus tundricola]|uniref:GT4 family glycosyltransferase n=1 Tax=Frigoriglobus tundricola TaxID=2774151 RepID=A0A6M5YFD5_9BACT|nr:glycosyltransferase [Frigoriglobus tundricola]QJW92709.1 GT4 family glycosyltransferase [Frigoriglobus tundricola]
MKIGIFQEPSGDMGGSELVTAIMAQALRDRHDVELVHHRTNFSVDRLESFFGLDLGGVRARFVERPTGHAIYSGRFLTGSVRYWREWDAAVSEPYDLFVANVHGIPPHCHARHGVLHVLFPSFNRTLSWPWGRSARSLVGRVVDPVRKRVYEMGWRRRMASYQQSLAISRYSAEWTERYWGVKSEVLYPPVLLDVIDEPKGRSIMSLGRFVPEKKQAELLARFIETIAPRAPGWELVFVGGLSSDAADQAYFTGLKAAAAGHPVRFVPNATRQQVRTELGRASIYWHVMGLGVDPAADPAKMEHFGIAPVEAMAAGAVPVVLDKGGPPEVVLNDECGYACASIDLMCDKIVGLVRDEPLLRGLSDAARLRARAFSVERFKERFLAYLQPILGPAAGVAG